MMTFVGGKRIEFRHFGTKTRILLANAITHTHTQIYNNACRLHSACHSYCETVLALMRWNSKFLSFDYHIGSVRCFSMFDVWLTLCSHFSSLNINITMITNIIISNNFYTYFFHDDLAICWLNIRHAADILRHLKNIVYTTLKWKLTEVIISWKNSSEFSYKKSKFFKKLDFPIHYQLPDVAKENQFPVKMKLKNGLNFFLWCHSTFRVFDFFFFWRISKFQFFVSF